MSVLIICKWNKAHPVARIHSKKTVTSGVRYEMCPECRHEMMEDFQAMREENPSLEEAEEWQRRKDGGIG